MRVLRKQARYQNQCLAPEDKIALPEKSILSMTGAGSFNFMDLLFLFNSILLGVGLAMDAFSVSIANGLNEPKMAGIKMSLIAGTYGFFQFAMPVTGWICVHFVVDRFTFFQKLIPWIAFFLLLFIGVKMIYESFMVNDESVENSARSLSFGILMMQGIATSIDALSVGFTISEYDFFTASFAGLIIAVVTFLISFVGLAIGKKAVEKFTCKSEILGGIILIGIGIEIFIKGLFF